MKGTVAPGLSRREFIAGASALGGVAIAATTGAVEAQLAARRDIGAPATSLLNVFSRLTVPVLVASGSDDRIPAHNSQS